MLPLGLSVQNASERYCAGEEPYIPWEQLSNEKISQIVIAAKTLASAFKLQEASCLTDEQIMERIRIYESDNLEIDWEEEGIAVTIGYSKNLDNGSIKGTIPVPDNMTKTFLEKTLSQN